MKDDEVCKEIPQVTPWCLLFKNQYNYPEPYFWSTDFCLWQATTLTFVQENRNSYKWLATKNIMEYSKCNKVNKVNNWTKVQAL